MTNGRVNPQFTLDDQGITGLGTVYYNLLESTLIEQALARKEGQLGEGGAFLVSTGKFTGRSPKDKHVVKTASVADSIWWENNAAMSEAGFEALYEDMIAHMQGRDYFVQDLFGGADPANRLDVRMVTELAWHGLFIRHMLRRPDADELEEFTCRLDCDKLPLLSSEPRAPQLPL
jgi:phosphoenolpyruvate carboxykinase (ATP)